MQQVCERAQHEDDVNLNEDLTIAVIIAILNMNFNGIRTRGLCSIAWLYQMSSENLYIGSRQTFEFISTSERQTIRSECTCISPLGKADNTARF